MSYLSIAVDGPAGSGKSTVAKRVANELDITYLDTGAMYRGVTYSLLKCNTDLNIMDSVEKVLQDTNIDFVDGLLHLNGVNIDEEIRLPEINKNVSKVACIKIVRDKLVAMQKEIASNKSIAMDGRDIGTNVLPNASHKFFLTASIEERAHRRYLEMTSKGLDVTLEALVEEIRQRDYEDTNRSISPLRQAKDAMLIDTTKYTIDEVVCLIKKNIDHKE